MKINFEISLRNSLFYKKKIQIQYCRDVLKSNEIDTETRSSHRRCSVKNVFLEISQNSQENTCDRVSFLLKLLALDHVNCHVESQSSINPSLNNPIPFTNAKKEIFTNTKKKLTRKIQ